MNALESERLAQEIEEALRTAQKQLPEIPRDQLIHILHGILRPFGSGKRWFLRKLDTDRYVP